LKGAGKISPSPKGNPAQRREGGETRLTSKGEKTWRRPLNLPAVQNGEREPLQKKIKNGSFPSIKDANRFLLCLRVPCQRKGVSRRGRGVTEERRS